MNERRKASRQRSFLHGCLYFNNRRSAIDCLIRDVSAGGARLLFSQTATIPDVVDLHIPQKDQWLRARVQWRSGGEVGVAFEQAPATTAPAPAGDLAQRVEQLELEVASLKRMVKRLKVDPEAA
jgi:PilZ domain-containing protein